MYLKYINILLLIIPYCLIFQLYYFNNIFLLIIIFVITKEMGQTNISNSQVPNFLDQYDITSRSDIGTTLSNRLTQETYLLKEINLMDQNQYNAALQKYKIKKQNIKENILNLVEVEDKIKTNFCSANFKIYLLFQYPNISLSDEILARIKQGRYFEEQDLWSIIQSCLGGIAQLEETVLLDPKKIFIMSDGLVKIVDPDIINDGSRFIMSEGVYYSPERFQNFNKTDRGNSSEKEMMFSLGMTLLNCSLLQECFNCYNFDTFKFNSQNLHTQTNKLKGLYSQEFIFVLENLLEINPNRRSSILQLQDVIHQFWTKQQNKQKQANQSERQIQQNVTKLNLQMQNYNNQTVHEQQQRPVSKQNQQMLPNKVTFSEICNVQVSNINCFKKMDGKGIQNHLLEDTKQKILNIQNRKPLQNLQNFKVESIHQSYFPYPADRYQNSYISSTQNLYNSFHYDNFKYLNPISINYFPITNAIGNQNLFTDPKLLESVRKDITQINCRKMLSMKQSIYQNPSYPQSYRQSIPNLNKKFNNLPKTLQNPIYTQSCYKNQSEYVIQNYQDGRRYEGFVVNGIKQGKGKLTYPDGAYYQGQFMNNKMHGFGILYYNSEKPAYEGNWFQDQFHGKGILYHENPIQFSEQFNYRDFNQVEDYWVYYEGQFEYDNKQGKGKLILANKQYFQGQFRKDCINGKGIFYDKFGRCNQGIWDNNILQECL